ncbi:hypothetical protein [Gordonia sp. DT101]|uniref:hypothetical protein n=1 Tax=Gordonia sp. DT101 TaxID=3416545 RepID=UPI003CEAC042
MTVPPLADLPFCTAKESPAPTTTVDPDAAIQHFPVATVLVCAVIAFVLVDPVRDEVLVRRGRVVSNGPPIGWGYPTVSVNRLVIHPASWSIQVGPDDLTTAIRFTVSRRKSHA